MLNLGKSLIMVLRGVDQDSVEGLKTIFGFDTVDTFEKYLGLPNSAKPPTKLES